jgi:hypothetical protein
MVLSWKMFQRQNCASPGDRFITCAFLEDYRIICHETLHLPQIHSRGILAVLRINKIEPWSTPRTLSKERFLCALCGKKKTQKVTRFSITSWISLLSISFASLALKSSPALISSMPRNTVLFPNAELLVYRISSLSLLNCLAYDKKWKCVTWFVPAFDYYYKTIYENCRF